MDFKLKSLEISNEEIPENISFVRVNKNTGEIDKESLENTYFELLAAKGEGLGAALVNHYLQETSEGLIGIVLGTEDIDECYKSLQSKGYALGEISAGEGINFKNGAIREWKNLFLPPELTRGIFAFIIQHTKGSLEEFKNDVKIGRTHLMDATPLTLSQEFSGYESQIKHGLKALENTLDHIKELAIGGTAVGTGLNTPRGFDKETVKNIRSLTGINFKVAENKFESIASNDSLVETHGALKQIAVSLFKIANDIRLLGSGPRSGFSELILPANEPGSSIMPGKVNPTQCEAMTMVCAEVIGNDTTVTFAGSQGHLELNVFKPVLAFKLIESSNLLADACESFNKNCVAGLKANKKRINEHLKNSLMLITALNKKIGYYKAAEIANNAHKNGTTLKVEALKLGYVSEDDFDKWVDPNLMI